MTEEQLKPFVSVKTKIFIAIETLESELEVLSKGREVYNNQFKKEDEDASTWMNKHIQKQTASGMANISEENDSQFLSSYHDAPSIKNHRPKNMDDQIFP